MVIVKNPTTGKYEIKPSPPSFYESKPSGSTGGTSGGGGSSSSGSSSSIGLTDKPIYDNSGKLTGIDTGTQSRMPTIYDQLKWGNQTPTGGTSGGGGSSVSTSGSTVTIGGVGYSVAPSQQAEFIKQQTGGIGTSAQTAIQRMQDIANQQRANLIKVSAGGRVTVGSGDEAISYIGNAYIGEVGMTANEYNAYLRREAVKSGGVGIKDYGKVSFSGIKTGQETLPTGEVIIYNKRGDVSGIQADLGYGMKSYSIEAYNKEVKRLQSVSPSTAVLDTKSGGLTSGTISKVKLGELELTPRNQVQVYTDPMTGEIIKDIKQYYIEKNIPFTTTPRKITSPKDFYDVITEATTYDIEGLKSKAYSGEFGSGGLKVGKEWLASSQAYGGVSSVVKPDYALIKGIPKIYLQTMDTATSIGSTIYSKVTGEPTDIIYSDILPKKDLDWLEYKPLVRHQFKSETFLGRLVEGTLKYYSDADILKTTGLAIAVASTPYLAGKIITPSNIGIVTGLDIMGYSTGINKRIKEELQPTGQILRESAFKDSGMVEFGASSVLKYGVGAGIGLLSQLPAQSKTELVLDIAIGKASVSQYKLLKVPARSFVAGYSGYKFVTGETFEERALGALGIFAVSPDIIKVTKMGAYKFSPDYVKTKTDVTGIKYADIDLGKTDFNIKTGTLTKEIDPLRIEFIPSRKEIFTERIDPLKVMSSDIPLKNIPSLPKISDIKQKQIVEIVRERGDIISGSYAQQALVKDSRPFKDIDIISRNEELLVKAIGEKLGSGVKITKPYKAYVIEDVKTGKELANIVKLSEGEFGGIAKVYEPIDVKGVKLLSPDVRLLSKIYQQTEMLPKQKKLKVIGDIAQLMGDKKLATSPSLLRGYGLSKAEQKTTFLGGEFFATHGGINLIPRFGDEIILGGTKLGSPELFFSTPSKVTSGIAFTRTARMGLGGDIQQATLRDILRGEKLTFFGGRKQVLIEIGKLGDDFIQPNIRTSEIEVARVLPKEGTQLKILKRFKTIAYGEPIEIAFAGKINVLDSFNKLNSKKLNDLISKNLVDTISRRNLPKQISFTTPIRTKFTEDLDVKTEPVKSRTEIKRLSLIERQLTTPNIIRTTTRVTKLRTPTRPTRRDIISNIRLDIPIREPIRTPRITTPIREPIRVPRIKEPVRFTRIPIRPTEFTSKILKIDFKPREPKRGIQKVSTFSVEIKRRGKFKPIGTGLSYGKALKLGELETLSTLGRTFKVQKTGFKEVGIDESFSEPDLGVFRKYKVRGGKKLALPTGTFIQRQRFSLGSFGERTEIQRARKQSRELNNLINM